MRITKRKTFASLLFCGLALLILYLYLLSRHGNCPSGLQCLVVGNRPTDESPPICVLPQIDPFHESIKHLIQNYPNDVTAVCGKSNGFFQLVNGRIRIRDISLLTNVSERTAKYEIVIRPRGEDNKIMYSEKVAISGEGEKIDSDFIKVSYKLKNGSRKVEMFAQIAEKLHVFKRKSNPNRFRPNVVLMGFDSTSSANFKRKLKRTFKYLVENLDAFVFNGYTIIGDGTTPALTAILTGNLLSSMVSNNHTNLESWPWVMNNYRRRGYVTMYAEDDPQVASFVKLGSFRHQPTDHYMRPFWLAAERHGLDGHRRNKSNSLQRVCLNNEPLHNITFNYLNDFLAAYKGLPKFAFPYFSYLPHGTGEKLGLLDNEFLLFLKNYEKYRNNSILITFGIYLIYLACHYEPPIDDGSEGDHGARVGAIRNTIQGTYEEHLPWLSIVVPPWFKEKFPELAENMMANQDRIVSAFDLHHTLHHILNLDRQAPGTSLMSELSPLRSCSDAGVTDEHWCPCIRWEPEDVNSIPIKKAAQLLVNHINKIISKKQIFLNLCFTLYLVDIILGAKSKTGNIVYYQVIISTNPGEGRFQATFRYYPDSSLVMTSHVSRTSMFGRNPWCLERRYHFMRRFCMCKIPYRKHPKRKRIFERT